MNPIYTLILLLAISLLSLARCSCGTSDLRLLSLTFASVPNFQPPNQTSNCVLDITLPSRNLTGTVSWMILRNITSLRSLDLSGNALDGSIPTGFWSNPSLSRVNLAFNHLGGALRFGSHSPSLRSLNLSNNHFTGSLNVTSLVALRSLDVSHNSISGSLPKGFLDLDFLNVSYNNFTGIVDSRILAKFGRSAFVKAGAIDFTSSIHEERKEPKDGSPSWGIIAGACVLVGLVIILCCGMCVWKRRSKSERGKGGREVRGKEEEGWVGEARWGEGVVVFEKPLMELTFGDLAAATSGFGRESMLAEGGRSGKAYRAVLPGDMHVVVRVMESARELAAGEAAEGFRKLRQLRHPNLLPLLGYCIPGREKLLLYEYMQRGDLHRWLHELPAGKPNVEDWSGDTWDHHHPITTTTTVDLFSWHARHRIAVGVARGMAFLHQRPVAHGRLVPSNILLGDDLEPRVADFGLGGGSVEGDVYSFGLVVMELVTGRSGWEDGDGAVGWVRGLVRAGRGAEAVDSRLRLTWEREMVECLRVGYLCTAESPEKRPTMQQVVGLLKDIRSSSSVVSASSS